MSGTWREAYGLPPKRITLCPVCGNESMAGRTCHYHKRTEGRVEYHSAYYRANREKLAEESRQRRARWRLKKKLKPLIDELKAAVDLGRMTARW